MSEIHSNYNSQNVSLEIHFSKSQPFKGENTLLKNISQPSTIVYCRHVAAITHHCILVQSGPAGNLSFFRQIRFQNALGGNQNVRNEKSRAGAFNQTIRAP